MTNGPSQDFPKAYDHHPVEERLYKFWMDNGFFKPKIDHSKTPFVIIMPPPNVTGALHLGHALTASLQDAMTRWHRMMGDPALWLPGTDHAGIATQVVVERMLRDQDDISRHDLGRDQFVERVWQWVGKYGSTIDQQHQRLGASCDWSRKRFTLDAGPSLAVRTTFVNLYRKGLIYQGERIINWCPRCMTALSDLETKHGDEDGKLYYIRYPYEDGSGYLTVATTRPETMLGDTAIAVHPTNPKTMGMAGKRVILPIMRRPIPVIADEAVELDFGTGALKVTPGHDPVDFDIGQRHGLPVINILNLDATVNAEGGPYAGMDRYEARKKVLEQLEAEGLLEKIEPHPMSIGRCDRCDTIVEPLVSKQWFMRMRPLADRAAQAVLDRRITIIPERFTKVYLSWMENIRDWCVSRQLWWGHRIPVWYCDDCGALTVEVETPKLCSRCASSHLRQDPDVLDTWFSSGLWPSSTLGWPKDTEDYRYFYPTTVMETGYDILFFWVARMVMMGLENTGDIPFKTVYLHGLVRDPQGAKMSKSKGNVVDPLKTIDEYGADALRFALTTGITPGNDTRLSPARMEAARNFANKLWNASRFVATCMEGATNLSEWSDPKPTHREDRWVLSQFNRVVEKVNQYNRDFQFGEAQREQYDFLWGTFCDWYIELAKVRLRNGDTSVLPVLAHVLEGSLRLLHPYMPFVTEEIWQRLLPLLPAFLPSPLAGEGQDRGPVPPSIMVAPYPQAKAAAFDADAEAEMELVTGIVRGIRNVRAEFKLDPRKPLEALVSAEQAGHVLSEESDAIKALARVEPLTLLDASSAKPATSGTVTLVAGKATVYLPLGSAVDVAAERKRLQSEMASALGAIRGLEGRLSNVAFLEKAPEEVVDKERERLETLRERTGRIGDLLAVLG